MTVRMPRRDERLEVTPDEIGDDGLAIARITWGAGEDARRLRVKVRGAVPGDRVVARVGSRVRNDVHARVAELVSPSPHRIAPRCRHAAYSDERPYCGGCTLQSLDYRQQLHFKAARVAKALRTAGIDLSVADPVAAPVTFGHRHKMELSFATDPDGEVALGLHPPGYKWEVVALAECPLLSPLMSTLLPALGALFRGRGLRSWDPRRDDGWLRNLVIREAKRRDERLIEIVTTPLDPVATTAGRVAAAALIDAIATEIGAVAAASGVALTSLLWTVHDAQRGRPTRFATTVLRGASGLTDALRIRDRELVFDIGPRAFFQPHPQAAERLVEEVLTRLGPARTVLDLYSGTGTLALAVAPFVGRVVGVELVPEAVANAVHNAARNGLDNAEFIAGDVARVVADPALSGDVRPVDAVLLDPPRSGLSPPAFDAVRALDTPRIVYVSCKPESLARDLVRFAEHGYRPEPPAQPIDLFPQSHHVETVVTLVR